MKWEDCKKGYPCRLHRQNLNQLKQVINSTFQSCHRSGRESKFFQAQGKLWAFILMSGKIDNLKENDFVFIWCGKWSFLSRKGQEKFLATTRIACLPKTCRFLTLFFLWGTEGHMVEYLFYFLFIFCIVFKPKIPAKNSWDTCGVSPIPPIQCWKISRFFQQKKRKKILWLSTLKVGGGENLLRVPTLLSGIVGYTGGRDNDVNLTT